MFLRTCVAYDPCLMPRPFVPGWLSPSLLVLADSGTLRYQFSVGRLSLVASPSLRLSSLPPMPWCVHKVFIYIVVDRQPLMHLEMGRINGPNLLYDAVQYSTILYSIVQ